MKRILSIQDISCVGKCSLTVALPIISAMGIETSVLPTAVLSTHTMFRGFTFRDLTCDIAPIAEHWKREGFTFDAIYTGYLGSFEQLNIVSRLINDFRTPENLIFIDPVMADNGKLYPGFTPEFAKAMAGLCRKADVIVPNITEASFLLEEPYIASGYDESYIRGLLTKLAALGPRYAVLTGVSFEPGKTGIMGLDGKTGEFFQYTHRRVNVSFHGTGDLFSSTALGGMMRGLSLLDALTLAADFTVDCIENTMKNPNHVNYAVEFEPQIPGLIDRMRGLKLC